MTDGYPITPDQARKLRDKATPGPWALWNGWGPARDGLMRFERIGPRDGTTAVIDKAENAPDLHATRADAELVVNAPSLASAFLMADKAREAAEAKVAAVEAELAHVRLPNGTYYPLLAVADIVAALGGDHE